MRSVVPLLALFGALFLAVPDGSAQRSKKKQRELERELSLDPEPKEAKKKQQLQALEVPKEPPPAVTVDPRRLTFHVSPLSGKGLLSQQVKDGFRSLLNAARGGKIMKIRAFVAGTGDLRRVQAIVSEECTERRIPIPVVSVVQAGALPHDGAQVVMEAIALQNKEVNPKGITFLEARPPDQIPENALRTTCYLGSLQQLSSVKAGIAVQLLRDPTTQAPVCEAVIPGGGGSQLTLTGMQFAFGREDRDLKLALGRLEKALESVNSGLENVSFVHVYGTTRSVSESMMKLVNSPSGTALVFEALPAADATVGIDAVAR